MREIQKAVIGLVSSFSPEETGLKLSGILVTREKNSAYNFSLFDVSESEVVLMLQIGSVVVYLAFEGEEEIDEEEYPELVEELIGKSLPGVKELIRTIEGSGLAEPRIVYDEMSPELKEFMYDVLMRYLKGRSVYDQTELA
ncbi:hypothetical protein A3L09_03645 [Thermococcus profundus]|uniref:Uncharacterized protein n=1 Tax=Thermococcus profundus TaxID=49899 RepID=A0A2Z2MKD0_THEPR|nr:hypothetical protein [Thermococcus profundus]ASJ02408.1 hypothetical protein A3L09_03645 [Thermococcus profundus]